MFSSNCECLNYIELHFFFVTIFRAKKRILRFGNQQTTTTTEANTSPVGPYKRAGGTGSNIHRLSDKKDSDDENNTWNGNSTQQQ